MIENMILLDAAPAAGKAASDAGAAAGSGMINIVMIVALIFIFYFFMIRPQQKKQKELRKQREAMAKGDSVVTAGGIYGRIREIDASSNTLIIEVDKDVKIRVDRNSVYPDAAQANEAARQK